MAVNVNVFFASVLTVEDHHITFFSYVIYLTSFISPDSAPKSSAISQSRVGNAKMTYKSFWRNYLLMFNVLNFINSCSISMLKNTFTVIFSVIFSRKWCLPL